jgi:hypothetical protein
MSTPWRVATGTYSRRYPYWVTRTGVEGRSECFPNNSGNTRRFETREAAQRVADRLQITADFDDAREYARLATHHLIRATNHLQPNDPLVATLSRLSDIYIELTGRKL